MKICKNCRYYGRVDDYYGLSGGCTLTKTPQGFYDSCDRFVAK